MLPKGKIIIISGPSGSGKTTLFKKLLARKELKNILVRSISVTTRSPRPGEVNGRDYIFVSPKMFIFKKKRGHFLESEEVFGNYYGTPKKNVLTLLKSGLHVLLCIDVNGAKHVCQRFPNAVRIFIKTSSIEALKERLTKRGAEDNEVVNIRLQRAQEELQEAKLYNYIIINDNLATAFKKLLSIVKKSINVQ